MNAWQFPTFETFQLFSKCYRGAEYVSLPLFARHSPAPVTKIKIPRSWCSTEQYGTSFFLKKLLELPGFLLYFFSGQSASDLCALSTDLEEMYSADTLVALATASFGRITEKTQNHFSLIFLFYNPQANFFCSHPCCFFPGKIRNLPKCVVSGHLYTTFVEISIKKLNLQIYT